MGRIIGQETFVQKISNIFKIYTDSSAIIRPHSMVCGPSGSGKTYIINSICEDYGINFIEVNAAQLTKEGASGNSLSKILSSLINFKEKFTVIFVDEFDKLFLSGDNNYKVNDVTIGVQNEFLKVLESKQSMAFGDYGKYVPVNVGNCLFIFSGAFNNEPNITIKKLQSYGVKTEFLGRVSIIFNLEPLSLMDLIYILKESELLKQYLKLYPKIDYDNVIVDISKYISNLYENNEIGARMINTILHYYFINNGIINSTEVGEILQQAKRTRSILL